MTNEWKEVLCDLFWLNFTLFQNKWNNEKRYLLLLFIYIINKFEIKIQISCISKIN